jgi:plastocyanin
MTLRVGWMLSGAAVAALVAPGVAQAAVKSVSMGTPPATAKTLQRTYFSDANAFFPSSVTIRVGDRVRFVPNGFHNVHFPGSTGRPSAPFIPTGQTIAGVNDAAGAPFWFNGLPELSANPQVFGPGGSLGKTVVTDGTKEIQSGAPISDRPRPMVVRFTKAGVFRYVCDIHPGMRGTVRVASRRARVPSAAADARRVRLQGARAITVAKRFKNVKAPANTVNLGLAGPGGVSQFAFNPSKLTVPVGTTVTFRMARGDTEVHTATAGPGNPEKQPKSYLGVLTASLESPKTDPRALYPSDPPPAAATLTSALHGNGFWNTGALDSIAATPLGNQSQVRFGTAGTYTFYCLIHPFMRGTITAR